MTPGHDQPAGWSRYATIAGENGPHELRVIIVAGHPEASCHCGRSYGRVTDCTATVTEHLRHRFGPVPGV